jgi:ribosomal protein S18 acetylase RimI-like enzyme
MRAPALPDALLVAELTSRYSPEPYPVEMVEREWTEPNFELAEDARLLDGSYAAVWDDRAGRAWLDFQGPPPDELFDWAEARAIAKGLPLARGGTWDQNAAVKGAFERHGYELIRHSYRMHIDLARVPEAPVWPDRLTVRAFRPGDEERFYAVHQEAFEDHWGHDVQTPYEEWAHWFLQAPMFEPELWFVVEEDGEPAGIAIDYVREETEPIGWVQILGVRRPWRRRGLGRALLLHAFAAFRARGLRQAGLGVDASNPTGATQLYESVGMTVSYRFDIYEKHLS